PQAGDWVDEQLQRMVGEQYPAARCAIHMVREWKEKHSFVGDSKHKVMVTAPVDGKPTQLDITTELKAACEGLLRPVAETMLDLVSRVDPEYQEKVRNNVVLSGGTGLIRGFGPALEAALGEVGGGRVRVGEDPLFVGY